MSQIHDLAAIYALDGLEAGEAEAFERHLEQCPECRRTVAEFQETAATMAADVELAPPPHLRAAVLEQLDEVGQLQPGGMADVRSVATRKRWRVPLTAAIAAVIVALVAVFAGTTLWPSSDLDELLAAADAQEVPVESAASIEGRVVYSAERDTIALDLSGVELLAAGTTYQLWLIGDAGPTPSILFSPDEDGKAIEFVETDVGAVGLVAVTVEPAAGSDAPTGEILMTAPVEA